MDGHFTWLNEPEVHRGDAADLHITTGAKTDFWQETFYGFARDNGHAYLTPVEGDFTARVRFSGDYRELYDQAGLMLRIDARTWIKTGIEYTDGRMHFSVVVTNGRSDWSIIPLPNAGRDDEIAVQLTRHGNAVRVQFSVNDARWQLARLAPFSDADASVGMMACSPERAGFSTNFRAFCLGAAIDRKLDD